MTLRHLRIFIAVFQAGSITKAAQSLHMTQPAVTRAIQELEAYYGIRLFERIHRRLAVTQAGEAFYAYALHIADSFDRLETSMRNWDELGALRVGATMTIGHFVLPRVLLSFRQLHPRIRTKASISNGASLQQALLNNELDFAAMEGEVTDPLLHAERFAQDRLIPVLPPESALRNSSTALAALVDNPLLLRESGSAVRTALDRIFAAHGISAEPAMESISTQAIVQAVHLGLGISFLPEQLAASSVKSGFVATCSVTDESFRRDNFLVWHKHKYLTRSATEMMNLFREAVTKSETRE